MLPLFLQSKKIVSIPGRNRFFDFCQRAFKFISRVRDENFQRTLVHHRNDAAFDCLAQQVACKVPPLFLRDEWISFPPLSLRFDVWKGLGKRVEFDESVEGECNWATIFCNNCGWRD